MTAGIGHNSGAVLTVEDVLDPEVIADQLALDHQAKVERKDNLLAKVAEALEVYGKTGIPDDDIAGDITDLLAMLGKTARTTDDVRKAVKAPYAAAVDAVDGFFFGIIKPLNEASRTGSPLQWLSTAYLTAKAERERLAREDEARKAREAADLLAAKAQQALAAGNHKVLRDVIQADDRAQAAEVSADARDIDLSRTRGTRGSVASLADNWVFKVVNLAEVPREWLRLDEEKVRLAIRRKADPVRSIPGLEITNDRQARSR